MKILIAILSFISLSNTFAGSLYTKGKLWDVRDIQVCFAAKENDRRELSGDEYRISSWSAANKKKIQEFITSEYTLERTHIKFSGWKECDEAPDAKVVVFYGQKKIANFLTDFFTGYILGLSTIGPSLYRELPQYLNAESFVWLYSDGINRGTATHEFGHSLGLHHEHYQWEARNDPRCIKEHIPDAGYAPNTTDIMIHGMYDPESIMSYCTIHEKGGFNKGLSPRDVELLQFLYP